MEVNNFFSSEVKKFMDTERLDERYGYESAQSIENNAEQSGNSDNIGLSRILFESMTAARSSSGGGGRMGDSGSFSAVSMGGSVGYFSGNSDKEEKELAQQEKKESAGRQYVWHKEKDKEVKRRIRTKEGTKGEWTGHAFNPYNITDEGDKYYKKNSGGYIPVQSSNLKAVKYDAETKQLNVQFLSGSEYSYDGVSKGKYNNLMGFSSHGSYFYWNIRGKGVPKPISAPYPYRKI